MSNIPYTSLVINQRGVDVFSEKDVIYLLAPANQGGEKRDADGKPIVVNGLNVFEAKAFSDLTGFEYEFGLAADGSPASMYAKWIFEKGNFNVLCRRIVADDLSFSSVTMKSEEGIDVLDLQSLTTDYSENNIMIDVSSTAYREAFLYSPNATLDSNSGNLTLVSPYTGDDYIVFEGKHFNTNTVFRVGFNGQFDQKVYSVLDIVVDTVSCESKEYYNVGNGVAQINLGVNDYSYDVATREIRFGSAPTSGTFNVFASAKTASGQKLDFWFGADGISCVYKTNFMGDNVDFRALYVNGIGFDWDQKIIRDVRFVTTDFSVTQDVSVGCQDGTLPGTAKLIVVGKNNGSVIKEEVYDNLQTMQDLFDKIKDSPNYLKPSKLIDIELMTAYTKTKLTQRLEMTALASYGVRVSVYKAGGYETYDGIRDVAQAADIINNNSSLVSAEVLALSGGARLKNEIVGLRMSGANPGKNVSTIDYLAGLIEGESVEDITVVIAPGISDAAFHGAMKSHCVSCAALGRYRICIVGGEIGESVPLKQQRAVELSHELVCCIGDGLYLTDPRTSEKRLFPPSVAVAPFVGQLLSEKFFACQTHKYISNASGIEHEYSDADLDSIRFGDGRLVMFRFDSGVQIVDAITTSPYNAYEDIHMVRLYHVISRNIRASFMRNIVGKSNLPAT